MPDPYELLVKEYLEIRGWIVRVDTRFLKKGRGWSDLDILATKRIGKKSRNIYLAAEVKSKCIKESDVDEINRLLEHSDIKEMLKERFDIDNYSKWIYCWHLGGEEKEKRIKNYAKKFKIRIKTFDDIICYILKELKKSYFEEDRSVYEKDYPYTTILQIIINAINVGTINISDFEREKR